MTCQTGDRDWVGVRRRRRATANVLLPAIGIAAGVSATTTARAQYMTPAQIRTAYDFNGGTFNGVNYSAVSQTGAGQTIAIVDTANDATILNDVNAFSTGFNGTGSSLPTFNSGLTGAPKLTVISQTGSTTALPTTDYSADESHIETTLDVEWAHAIAPKANIVLVEANSLSDADLNTAINTAKSYAGVSVVSMSFGGEEQTLENSSTAYSNILTDATFSQPGSGHNNVAFLASTGDTGYLGYPAASSKVIAVGATSLTLNGANGRTSEVAWNNSIGATGSGTSLVEAKPTFQNVTSYNGSTGVLGTLTKRGAPDVSWNGDPNTGYQIYLTYNTGTGSSATTVSGFTNGIGGTSISCPQWAGLIALADDARNANGLAPLSTDQALNALYALYGTTSYTQAFYDVTSGAVPSSAYLFNNSNGATTGPTDVTYTAGPGYDETTGLGVPNGAFLVQYLGTYAAPEPTSLVLLTMGLAPLLGRRRRGSLIRTGASPDLRTVTSLQVPGNCEPPLA